MVGRVHRIYNDSKKKKQFTDYAQLGELQRSRINKHVRQKTKQPKQNMSEFVQIAPFDCPALITRVAAEGKSDISFADICFLQPANRTYSRYFL